MCGCTDEIQVGMLGIYTRYAVCRYALYRDRGCTASGIRGIVKNTNRLPSREIEPVCDLCLILMPRGIIEIIST